MTMTASAVQRALSRRVRALERDLPGVLDGDVEALHRSRVASRRLREILPVLGLERDPGRQTPIRKLRRRLRRLTSALGGVRELDVALGILDELRRDHPELEQTLLRARSEMEADRTECREEMTRHLHEFGAGAIFDQLARVVEDAARRSQVTRVTLLRQRLRRRANRVEAAVADAGSLFALDRLHQVRIAAKQLRYALELIHEFGRVPALRLVGSLKQLQDLLGRLHDLEVVSGYIHRLGAAEPAPQADAIERAAERLDREMRELHASYLTKVHLLDRVVAACRADVERRLAGKLAGPARRRHPWPTVARSSSSGTRSPRSAARSSRTTRGAR